MPRIISRTPKTPRKIRDIRPKRQLARNKDRNHDTEEDDWWYSSGNSGGESAAVKRYGSRRPLTRNSEPDIEDESHTRRRWIFATLKLIFTTLKLIFATLKRIYEKVRQAPRQERRKRFFWGIILITAWRTIYFADLDQYSSIGGGTTKKSSSLSSVTIKSLDDEFSNTDDESSSLFGNTQPKMAETGIRSSGLSGSESTGNLLGRETTGQKTFSQTSYPDSLSLFNQQKSRSIADPVSLGGGDYGVSRKTGMSNAFGLFPSNKMEAKTSQLDSSQSQLSWGNQQQLNSPYQEIPKDPQQQLPEYSLGKDKFQGLRGDNSGSDYNSKSFQTQSEYQQSNKNSQSMRGDSSSSGKGFSMSKHLDFGDNPKSESFQTPSKGHQSIGNFDSTAGSDDINTSSGGNSLSMNKKTTFSPQGEIGKKQEFNSLTDQNQNVQQQVPMASQGSTKGLDCSDYGGPFLNSEYAEIVYWRDIPADASFTSPYYNPQAQESKSTSFWRAKYVTFEMDDAGWNNMRLGLENVMLLAHSMGRTLVMPPKRQIAHGMYDKSGSKVVSFRDFYDIDAISAKQKGLNIITMEQFLEREALNGKLKSRLDGEIMYPPNNQIQWDNQRLDPLWNYIRDVTKTFQWEPKECVLAFPASGTDDQHLFSMMADVLIGKDGRPYPHYSEYQGKPVNVDAPPIERFREILAGRRKVCMYDRKMHDDNPVVHFKADQVDGTRLITQFYAFLWFEDWRNDLWSKRFIRDNLRYNNEIMCLSARIISALRDQAKQRSPANVNGFYDALHIRRGDFQTQFPMTKMDANEILAELKESITPGSTLFIATNERDISFFGPIQDVYDVSFVGDFGGMLSDINPNYFPLVEQIVASRGRIFFGTYFSTFSAYITRLRGYYSVKERHDGHMSGILQNTYFLPAKWKSELRMYQGIRKPLYGRDFPVAWRDIDRLELPQMQNNKLKY